MQVIPIGKIKLNPDNPRTIKKGQIEKLKASLTGLPSMLEVRPIVIDEANIILGGNARFLALKELGVPEVPVIQVKDWTKQQKRKFVIADNAHFGEWDYDRLANEWETQELEDWGVNLPSFDSDLNLDQPKESKQSTDTCPECGKPI